MDQEGYTSQHFNALLGSRRQNFGRESFLAFCSEFERHTLQDRLSRTLDRAHDKYVRSKGAQNRCQLCPKSELNMAKRWHFTSVIQDAKVIINHWDKPDDGVIYLLEVT